MHRICNTPMRDKSKGLDYLEHEVKLPFKFSGKKNILLSLITLVFKLKHEYPFFIKAMMLWAIKLLQ